MKTTHQEFMERSEPQLFWIDPDPIEGNDYKVITIKLGDEISEITYNGGLSNAKVFNSELKFTY